MFKVLKDFPYSDDGFTVVRLLAGASVPIRADLVEGLKAEGYIGAAGKSAAAPAAPPAAVAAADVKTETTVGDQFDAMEDKVLRKFLKERDGRAPNNLLKRPALLKLARGEV